MADRRPVELVAAGAAVLLITLAYGLLNSLLGGAPAASSFAGHSLGVLGFLLMLMTEVLYSLRKRTRLAQWGQMSAWLRFHIFTGIVGPYMVLLHSSWKFSGLAGVLTLMTGVIVASGFVGRYLYTAVPRTADGLEMEGEELARQIAALEGQTAAWTAVGRILSAGAASQAGGASLPVGDRRVEERLPPRDMRPKELKALLRRRDDLRRQAGSLRNTRRLLATWHAVHVPIGLGLFLLAFIHMGAAVYYATLLR